MKHSSAVSIHNTHVGIQWHKSLNKEVKIMEVVDLQRTSLKAALYVDF